MAAPRVDLFTIIHKALRRIMYETGCLLERTNFTHSSERGEALESLSRTLGFLDEHLELEDDHAVDHVAEIDPALAARLSEEHRAHEATSGELKSLMKKLETAEGPAAIGLGVTLCKAYNAMVAHQSVHMNAEETLINEALWAARTDEQLAEIRNTIQAAIPPPRFAEWLQIMLPNMNHQELVGVLGVMKASAPAPAYAAVAETAQKLLGDRWAAVQAALPG